MQSIKINYLRALRSSTTSICDVIDDWWLIVDRAPPAVRPPANTTNNKIYLIKGANKNA